MTLAALLTLVKEQLRLKFAHVDFVGSARVVIVGKHFVKVYLSRWGFSLLLLVGHELALSNFCLKSEFWSTLIFISMGFKKVHEFLLRRDIATPLTRPRRYILLIVFLRICWWLFNRRNFHLLRPLKLLGDHCFRQSLSW